MGNFRTGSADNKGYQMMAGIGLSRLSIGNEALEIIVALLKEPTPVCSDFCNNWISLHLHLPSAPLACK